MTLHWFISRSARQATAMCRHVRKMRQAQRDTLTPHALAAIDAAVEEMRKLLRTWPARPALNEQMNRLEKAAVKHLKAYPNASMRENVEVLLVAIAVAMGIRTFFLQPFKIPTGSMQPTLYGITDEALSPNTEIPNFASRFFQYWFTGVSYVHVKAKSDGPITRAYPPRKLLIFNLKQTFEVGDQSYTVWFPPEDLLTRAGLLYRDRSPNPHIFHQGDDIIKLKVISGDHLFVDRFTYNFRRPQRGEVIVFETHGITTLSRDQQDQYYIKRLIATGGEKVQIGDDRHVIINGHRLDASTPHFELVYSLTGPPRESHYSGHLNQTVASYYHENLAPRFLNQDAVMTIRPDHYLVMGDNTLNSSDSRTWGDFPQEKVIGRAYFVYWPIGNQDGRGSRFGWTTGK